MARRRSGITIGIGYDLGFVTVDQFESDWGPHLTEGQLKRLKSAIGKRAIAAKNRAPQFADIKIKRGPSDEVFFKRTIPLHALKTEQAFPKVTDLPPDAQGAVLSLVFNRGTSIWLGDALHYGSV